MTAEPPARPTSPAVSPVWPVPRTTVIPRHAEERSTLTAYLDRHRMNEVPWQWDL